MPSSKPLLVLALAALLPLGGGVLRFPAPAEAQEPAAAAVPPRTAASLTVTTDPVRRESVAARVSGTGLVRAFQEVVVGAPSGGLALTEVLVGEGDHVEAKAVVARLDSALIEAEIGQQDAAIRSAEASLASAVSANERGRKLSRSGAVSAETLEERQTAVKTAEAALEQAKAARTNLEVQRDRTVIRAPFAGVVSAKPAVVGSIVQAGAEIARVQRDGRLVAAVAVPEQYLSRIEEGDGAEVTGPDGRALSGRIASIAETVDTATHLGTVEVELPEGAGLKAGMFVRATISAGGAEAMTVATSALTFREGRPAVFVVGPNDSVALKPVSVGTRGGERVAIAGDLAEGDRVVTAGAGFLNDGATVRVVSSMAAGFNP